MNVVKTFLILNSSFFISLLAGCFCEPEPAYRTVPAGSRVYLRDSSLQKLTAEALLKEGMIFVAPDGMTNLSSRVRELDVAALDYLNLDRNMLTDVSMLSSFVGLKWLRLNDNQLTALPDLKGLVKLRRIYLKGNRFTAVPETLKNLPALTDIDLSLNPVKEVPQWLAEKKGLKGLSFTRTQITKLPDNLEAWESLQQLQLGELNLSPEEMARIRKALPDVAIVF